MTTARDEVLARVRSALADRPSPAPVARDYRRAGSSSAGGPELMALLAERLVDYRAHVTAVEPEADLAAAVSEILNALGAARIAVPAGFSAIDGPELLRDDGTLTAADLDGVDGVVTACAVAIAETGTIVLDHAAADQGRRVLSLVPDLHLVVVRAEQVVAQVPDALARLTPSHPQTWISGPSATSDIELQRVEGVHGPRTLQVLLVG